MQIYATFDTEELYFLAKYDFQIQHYEASLSKVKVIFTRSEIPFDVHSLAGRIYASIGMLHKAKQHFTLYLERFPDALDEKYHLGLVHAELNEVTEAQTLWDKVLEENSEYVPAIYQKAQTYINLDRNTEAVELLRKVVRISNSSDDYYLRAERLLKQIDLQ